MPPWRAKAAAQQLFSRLPAGHSINYLFQRHVTHGLPISDRELSDVLAIAERHLRGFADRSTVPIDAGRFFEFGAGWDLHIPQLLYCLGVEHQIVVDLRRLLRADLVFEVRDRLVRAEAFSLPRRPPVVDDLDGYLSAIGVDYRAPADARKTGLPSCSIDFVTSTNTLEHIPPVEISAILGECRRLLAGSGLMSFQIDYRDHYSYFDDRVSVYNFLRYSDRQWRLHNPPLHYQNRLRHSDYLRLFAAAGFEVLDIAVDEAAAGDRRVAEHLDLDEAFRHYALEDLTRQGSLAVLRPNPA
jgi:hypothetical protein